MTLTAASKRSFTLPVVAIFAMFTNRS